jgi:hypothetical protein
MEWKYEDSKKSAVSNIEIVLRPEKLTELGYQNTDLYRTNGGLGMKHVFQVELIMIPPCHRVGLMSISRRRIWQFQIHFSRWNRR